MSKVTVKPVTRDDVWPLIQMKVTDDQQEFVAPNAVSLAEVHYAGGGYPFVIRADGERVGLIQVIDCRECHDLEPDEDPNSIYLWRFMILPDRQGEGIGRRAMHWLESWARDRNATAITLGVAPNNAGAMGLYESCGYAKTGKIMDGEIEMAKPLNDPG